MSTHFKLNAEVREGTGTATVKKLRRQGIVPGVIYGGGQRNYPVQVNTKEITDLLAHASSENVLVDLVVEGAKDKNKLVLIQAVQHNTLSRAVTHIDFRAVREDEEIKATVPVFLSGEPIGVKQGGLLDHQVHQLEVRCLPKDLPESLTFDVTALEMGHALHIAEVKFPEGVTPTTGAKVVIALIAETRTTKQGGAA
jgi:large subunit ribosomal protein L25